MSDRVGMGAVAVVFLTASLNAGAGNQASLPDPTEPPSAPSEESTASPASRFSLDSILVGEQRRRAVINGISLARGGSLGGARVLHIGVDRVRIEVDGEQYTLELESAPSIRR